MKIGIYVLVMAAVTYIIRALPFTVFRKEIKSVWLKSFLYYVPYAVLGAMTFPAIFFSTGSIWASAAGCAAALVAALFGGGLMTAACVSVIAALLVGFIV